MSYLSRRKFFKYGGLSLFGLTSIQAKLFSKSLNKRPNILLIMSDDHAQQAISIYGSNLIKTPNIDRIGNEGIRFHNSFCTNAICAPSRAVLLTGKYSHINGQINNEVTFDHTQQTFPNLLQREGYQTALIGKWHLKSEPKGFDYWLILPGQGHYYNPEFIQQDKKIIKKSGYVTNILVDESIRWLKNRDKNKPFCLLLHHKAPHRNWMPDIKYAQFYKDRQFPVPDNFFDDHKTMGTAAKTQEMTIADHMSLDYDLKVNLKEFQKTDAEPEHSSNKAWEAIYKRFSTVQRQKWDNVFKKRIQEYQKLNLKGQNLQQWKYQQYMKDYLACIASLDEHTGRLLYYLDHQNLSNQTIVIYTSDQGFFLGEHGWYDKRFMYEESLRSPLLIRFPNEINPGIINKELVLNLDLAPTILDYADINPPASMQGQSMRSLLKGRAIKTWRKAIYYHYFEFPGVHGVKRHYGLRTHRYKLIHFYYDIDEWELYDLVHDPHECHNLYNSNKYRNIICRLKNQLYQLQKKYKDLDYRRHLPVQPIHIQHLALGCPVVLKYPNSPQYKGNSLNPLTNGLYFPPGKLNNTSLKNWLGFEYNDFVAILDLKKIIPINKIEIGFLHNTRRWIFLPQSVDFYISLDGKQYTNIQKFGKKDPGKSTNMEKATYRVNLETVAARYIMIKAQNIHTCPVGHPGAGGKAWLFTDEIVVR